MKPSLIPLIGFFVFYGCRVDNAPRETAKQPAAQYHKLESMYYEPTDTSELVPGVIVLGGSEGGINSAAGIAASVKYTCNVGALAVAYFGHKDLPEDLELIPLEYIAQGIEKLKSKPGIDTNNIGIMGVSKGGELALLMASHYPELHFVVAYVPSNVTYQGLKRDWQPANNSSWQFQRQPVPFLPYAMRWEAKGNEIVDFYEATLKHLDEYKDAIIPVENINGPILLISGEDDRMWPSTWMCNRIMERLDAHDFPFRHQHISHPNTGHFVASPSYDTTYGGTPEANYAAGEVSQKAVFKFLNDIKEQQHF